MDQNKKKNLPHNQCIDSVNSKDHSTCLPLCEYVEEVLANYFLKLEGDMPVNLYQMVLEQVEIPLFRNVLQYLNCNQSKAAKVLGVSRGTLCKKLKQYHI